MNETAIIEEQNMAKEVERRGKQGFTLVKSTRSASGVWKCEFEPPVEIPSAEPEKLKPEPKPVKKNVATPKKAKAKIAKPKKKPGKRTRKK